MRWRKSSYSKGDSACVELGEADGAVHVRNSNHPERGTLALPAAAVADFIAACRAGHNDDLAG
jgi:hypothetical protein